MGTIVNAMYYVSIGNDIYIGRNNLQYHYGNPFSHKTHTRASVKVSSREDAISSYRAWLKGEAYQDIEPERRSWILRNLYRLKNTTLVCWCKPLPCHGDVLLEFLE